jgi:hypothetical protein
VGPDFAGESVEVQFGDLMSTVDADGSHASGGLAVAGRRAYSTQVPGRTLSAVLDDAGLAKIDLLVLDIEGRELEVLAGLDHGRHSPRFLLIETLDRAAQQPAVDLALARGYDFVEALSDYDLLYRRRG